MLNPYMRDWVFTDEMPQLNREVWVLIEFDVILETKINEKWVCDYNEAPPHVRKAQLEQTPIDLHYRWHLLDCDEENEEPYLLQNFSVIAWRYVC